MNKLRNVTLLAFFLAISLPAAARANILLGRVVSVADGDTITMRDDNNKEYRIRLQGIDAPESSQSFGSASGENLAKLVFSKSVTVKWYKHDRYGRIVGNVFVAAQDAGLQQIRAGLAWHYKEYENEQSATDLRAYAEAEVQAREKKLGLWADPAPTPPWNYRHGGPRNPMATTVVPKPDTPKPPKQSTPVYIRGPRGGCYYLRGRKIYVDHSLCS